jgi:glucose/arabinose dehydrogenase
VRRAPLILALAAGALVVLLPGLAPPAARAAPVLAQIGDFNRPVFVVAPPRDTRNTFVVERGGTVRLLVDGTLRGRPFLDIRSLVSTSDGRDDERGLLSIAFAPDYAASGRFYAYYTSRQPPAAHAGDIVVDEFRRSASDPEVADPGTRRTLIAIEHNDYQNHNGGQLAFGPDAMLYAGTGDGGGSGDPLRSGQNVGSRLGKILRLDIRPGLPVAPAGNPFGAAGPEVWSLGLRNPFRFSFDRLTGDLTVGDVGQADIEEIDFVPKAAGWGRGANFGWSILEGANRYGAGRPARADELPAGYVGPVIEHAHSAGWCSITGGYVVRDPALPELYGRYVYGDYCKGELWSAVLTPSGAAGDGPVGLRVGGLSSLGEDGCGRLYAASIDGPVYRLATTGACAGPAPLPYDNAAGSGPGARTRADKVKPAIRLRVAGRQRVLGKGFIAVRVGCNELCRLVVGGRLLIKGAGRRSKLVRARRTLAANARVTLKVPVSLPARRLLRARFASRPLALVRLAVAATDAAGNRRLRKALVVLSR